MNVIHRLLFVTAMLGLVVGPLSIGAADSVMAASMPAAMDGMPVMNMSADMPCCPDELPANPDRGGKACPLALVCTTVMVGQVASTHSWSVNLGWVSYRFIVPLHEALASTLVDPPVRPPRV